jgi:hypothetical protein
VEDLRQDRMLVVLSLPVQHSCSRQKTQEQAKVLLLLMSEEV